MAGSHPRYVMLLALYVADFAVSIVLTFMFVDTMEVYWCQGD